MKLSLNSTTTLLKIGILSVKELVCHIIENVMNPVRRSVCESRDQDYYKQVIGKPMFVTNSIEYRSIIMLRLNHLNISLDQTATRRKHTSGHFVIKSACYMYKQYNRYVNIRLQCNDIYLKPKLLMLSCQSFQQQHDIN